MADWIPLVTALIGVVGGAAVTAGGSYLRNRRAVQTAALLIHAELSENSAQVRYFRSFRSWPDAGLREAAWEANGPILARLGSPRSFLAIRKGYAALEGMAFIAKAPPELEKLLPKESIERILETTVDDIIIGLRESGRLGRLDQAEIDQEMTGMRSGT